MIKLQFRDDPGRFLSLTADAVTLGRDPANDLCIDDASISDFHAEIVSGEQGLMVIDLVSATGTFVNERRVRIRQRLAAWDRLRLGTVELEINDPSVPRPGDWALRSDSELLADQFYSLGGETVIGRGSECEIAIDDALLSRRHVRISMNAGAGTLVLQDLGSANGTYVNGVRVGDTTLMPGDELRIGSRRFIVVGPLREAAPGEGEEDVTMLAMDATVATVEAVTEDLDSRTELISATTLPAWLSEQTDFGGAGDWPLSAPECCIGRTDDNDIVIRDGSVSRTHARLRVEGDGWRIQDAGSSNGVVVNGARVQSTVLQPGDVVELGRAVLTYHQGPRV